MSPALRSLLAALAALAFGAATAQGPAPEPAGRKVLHLAFRSAESSLDPAKVSDLYSRTVTPHIFEALYQYDHLARPIKVKPLVAAAMPDVSPDYRTWTVKVRPGIYFQDDPAFKGARRELVAQDFVYPSSALPTRPTRARPGAGSRPTRSSAWPRRARPRSTKKPVRLRHAHPRPAGAGPHTLQLTRRPTRARA
jgi:ABC-type oligopeptide transport system substrate-binding subunit